MNNKGFTLVELLGTIIILAFLALVAIPAINSIIRGNKSDLHDVQMESIKEASKSYMALPENIFSLPNNNECIYIYLSDLKKEALIDYEIKDPSTGELLSDDMIIMISKENNSLKYDIDVENSLISNCKYVGVSNES